jgi:small subunit ribosomal protein S20
MPQHKSAEKRMRQNEKRRKHNKSQKTRVRTKISKLKSMEDPDDAREMLNEVKGELDRLAGKGLIHKNKAANKKSALEKHVDQLADE